MRHASAPRQWLPGLAVSSGGPYPAPRSCRAAPGSSNTSVGVSSSGASSTVGIRLVRFQIGSGCGSAATGAPWAGRGAWAAAGGEPGLAQA